MSNAKTRPQEGSKVEDKIQESDELKKEIADVKCIL